MRIQSRIYSCCLTAMAVLLQIDQPVQAYYRCDWVPSDDAGTTPAPRDTESPSTNRQCYHKDSDIMSSFVNHCTAQQHSIQTCSDTGTWDCDAFVGFCKTLIKVEPPTSSSNDVSAASETVLIPKSDCLDERMFFSLQEMGLAVLVSFISGSVVLTSIMVLVWKCRHTKLERQQSLSERQREHRTAALEAITQIARVVNTNPTDTDTVFYLNPAYSKTVASDIIDIISENDHIYEEVMLRRMSNTLTKSAQLTPANSRKRSQIAKSSSLNSIIEIAEKLERLEKENQEILEKGLAPAGGDVEVKSENAVDYYERADVEAPSTSDSGIMEDVVVSK